MTQPARMQEVYTITIRNHHEYVRSLFVVGNRVQTIIGYSKVHNLMPQDRSVSHLCLVEPIK